MRLNCASLVEEQPPHLPILDGDMQMGTYTHVGASDQALAVGVLPAPPVVSDRLALGLVQANVPGCLPVAADGNGSNGATLARKPKGRTS